MILLIDNYDSFTFNLLDYLQRLKRPDGSNRQVIVRKNDGIDMEEIHQLQPAAIVISPGPGVPKDAGISLDIIDHFHQSIPILGICLGHQAIGQYFGARLVECREPVHGKTTELRFVDQGKPDPIFAGLEKPIRVMRYHSLQLVDVSETCLLPIAYSHDGVVMALKHPVFPLYGLQFHPESICTPTGFVMLNKWSDLVLDSVPQTLEQVL